MEEALEGEVRVGALEGDQGVVVDDLHLDLLVVGVGSVPLFGVGGEPGEVLGGAAGVGDEVESAKDAGEPGGGESGVDRMKWRLRARR